MSMSDVSVKSPMVMRVARPTDNLQAIANMYAAGLGFTVLDRFTNHDGFDGVILGPPAGQYHIEDRYRVVLQNAGECLTTKIGDAMPATT